MSLDNAANFALCTVSTGYNAGAVSIVLTSGGGARLPVPPFNASWYNSTDYPDPSDDPDVEIVRVTAISTDTLTITRAQEGTAATAKNLAGKTYKFLAGLTAKVINIDLQTTRSPLDLLTDDRNYQKVIEAIPLPTGGRSVVVNTLTGEGMMRCLQFSMEAGNFGWDGRLQIFVDGEVIPSIDVDLGTAFLTALEAHSAAGGQFTTDHVGSLAYGSARIGSVSGVLLFPMPYSNGLVVKFYNPGIDATNSAAVLGFFYSNIVYTTDFASPKRLRSVCQPRIDPLTLLAADTKALFLLTNTNGSLVWFSMVAQAATNYSYLERNYWVALDGETITFYGGGKPIGSFVGDGTEDAPFLSGWYFLGRGTAQARWMAVTTTNNGAFTTVAGFDYLAAYGGVKFLGSMGMGFGTEPPSGVEPGVTTDHELGYVALYYADITEPFAPMAPVISGVAGDQKITLTITPPLSQGSAPVTAYAGTLSPGSIPFSNTGESTLVITGLTNSTAYTVTLHAVNSVGNSANSNSIVVTPVPIPAPGAFPTPGSATILGRYEAQGLALSNNDPVASWTDTSGNARHLLQATAGFRPTFKTAIKNGKAAVLFVAASNTRMQYAGAGTGYNTAAPVSIIMVVAPGTGISQRLVDTDAAGGGTHGRLLIDADFTNLGYSVYEAGPGFFSAQAPVVGQWDIISLVANGANTSIYVNGVESYLGNAGGSGFDNMIFGSDSSGLSPFNGYMGSILVMSGAINDADREALEDFYSGTYQIAVIH